MIINAHIIQKMKILQAMKDFSVNFFAKRWFLWYSRRKL